MKLNLKILTLFFLLTILSCKEKQNVKSEDNLNNNWEELEISTRTEKIIISKFSDSAKYEQNLNNIALKILPEDGKTIEEEIVKKNINFTKSEKDSLAKYIYESVTEPKFTDILATEYAGSVSLKYNTGNVKLICEYNSVGDWSVVSDATKKIYKLISKKVEISKS
ncbi:MULTISPECIES: hypothetical protein [Chryseobacterium]|uniref:hypothetical protein n=1 Tax=Chryseobacterium TaxID=59732 RepID=UPI00226D764C|nr:hypothetical protein [Chryseobacterium sp. CY353]MCY0970764.1 hypothetical protein [Chryseobacterium sp. CY353]